MASSWTAIAGSWGAISIIIVLGWYYYSRDGNPPKRIGKQLENGSITEALNEVAPKSKKQKKKAQKTTTSNTAEGDKAINVEAAAPVNTAKSGLSKRKDVKLTKSTKAAQSSAVDPTPVMSKNVEKESDIDIKEFARQMTKAKDGTSFTNTAKDNKRVRTQKQSKINGSSGPDAINGVNGVDAANAVNGVNGADGFNGVKIDSSTSSNNGGDADDDLSSVNSPELSAITSPADTTGVSDMLETPGPGPVSLRITEPVVPTKAKVTHVKKPEVVETKKQRQNRLKREREKEANREAEAQRKVLEEKQRRTAREAEGRPAKNGNGWTYNSGLPANAWSAGKPKEQPVVNGNGALLDTIEDSSKLPTIIDGVESTTAKTNGTNGTASHWDKDLPSEEEQLRIIQEQSEESEWTTVPQPKRAKRKQQTGA